MFLCQVSFIFSHNQIKTFSGKFFVNQNWENIAITSITEKYAPMSYNSSTKQSQIDQRDLLTEQMLTPLQLHDIAFLYDPISDA